MPGPDDIRRELARQDLERRRSGTPAADVNALRQVARPGTNVPLVQAVNGRPGEVVPDIPANSGEQAIRVRDADGQLQWRSPSTIVQDVESGQYTPEPGNTYRLTDDAGNEYEVAAENLVNALRWHEEDPDNNAQLRVAGWEDERNRAFREASGATGTFLESAGRSALSGITLGASDVAESLVDAYRDPGDVARDERRRAAQSELHPIADFSGAVAGGVAPFLLTGGTSAASRAISATARGTLEAGEVAAQGVQRLATRLGAGEARVAQAVAREAAENTIQALPAATRAAVEADPENAAEAAFVSGAASMTLGTAFGLGARGAGVALGAAREVVGDWLSRRADEAAIRALEPRGRDLYNALGNASIPANMLRQYAPEALEAAGVPVASATDDEIRQALANETTRRAVNSAYLRNYLSVMSAEVPTMEGGREGRRLVRAMEFGQDVERIAENIDDLKGAAIRSIDDGLDELAASPSAAVGAYSLIRGIADRLDRTASPTAGRLSDDQVLALESEIEHVLLGAAREIGQGAHGFRPRVFRVDVDAKGVDAPVLERGGTLSPLEILGMDEQYIVRGARIRRGATPNDETAPVGSFLDLFRPSRADPSVTVGDELVSLASSNTPEGKAVSRFLMGRSAEAMDASATLRAYVALRRDAVPIKQLVEIRRGLDDIAYRHSQETNATAAATVAMRSLGKDIAGVFREFEASMVEAAAAKSPQLASAAAKYNHGKAMYQALEMVQPTANIAAYAAAFRNRRMSLSDYNSAQIAATALTGAALSTKGGFLVLASTANSIIRTRLEASLIAARRRMMRAQTFERSLSERNEMTRNMVQRAIGMTSAPKPKKRLGSSVTPARTLAAVGREYTQARKRLEEMETAATAEREDLREAAEVAPNTVMAMRGRVAAAAQALRARLPRSTFQAVPGSPEILPSREEMEGFIRDMNIAENPADAIRELASSAFPIETARALQELYPSTFRDIQRQLQEALMSGKFTPTYFQRVRLSLLFGVTTDPTLAPSYLAQTQALAASEPETEAPPRGNRPVQLGAGDVSTETERVSARAARRHEP